MDIIEGSLPHLFEDIIRRMLREGPKLIVRSSMWFFHVNLESRVMPKYFVVLVMGIGMLLQARVASMMLKGRSEKTIVDDLEGDG